MNSICGPVPLEGVLFGDAGVAWTRGENPSFADGTRDFVRSVGAGVRVNAFNFAVVEFDAVRPLDQAQADGCSSSTSAGILRGWAGG